MQKTSRVLRASKEVNSGEIFGCTRKEKKQKKKQGCFQETEKRQKEWGEMEARLKACCVAEISADVPKSCFAFFILTGKRGCETLPILLFYPFASASAAPAI